MKSMTNLEKFGLAAALIIACTFFYMKYMYDPQTKVLTTTLKKRNKVVAELNKLKDIPPLFQLEKSIEQDKKRLDELRQETGHLNINTGHPDEIAALLSKISTIMVMNDLKALSIVPKEREPGKYIDWSPFDMNIKGDFTGFVTFLKELEQLRDAVEVSGIRIASSGVKSLPLTIAFTLKI
ncbi:hypothetical protein DO021_17940 [Desulfobacter hydrogenophilus]|uniref:Pilus assembly protein PilO n=1 Tax=Desulfobacter hydrogenophilus TaxID=2291 RepID=A0A328FC32_9BACT|nr:type 4a pilus biogenesis protein PilO [Desulfobacter hydrogenophilus]NDY73629.1 type 4a pilus biogenesis protein PilO [Desulfobacter hydrogenophilus]QBH12122.1 hypothetical protein EYB58_03785 [Desulfobacter hydrogenophilus]RAM00673.1 hypothetical protein DO021_17940 [Desulfobacter hydrogenophilus]